MNKFFSIFDFGFGMGVGLLIASCVWFNTYERKITKEPFFLINEQEYQCGLTPRQVEINLLEDKIKKIKGD